jgi:two-component system cell cycle sensor histidine kinase/response regulator CckA
MRAMLTSLVREDVEIVLSLRPEVARIRADRSQIEHVVLNLAVNARDYMPKGGTLTIEIVNVALDAKCPIFYGLVSSGSFDRWR